MITTTETVKLKAVFTALSNVKHRTEIFVKTGLYIAVYGDTAGDEYCNHKSYNAGKYTCFDISSHKIPFENFSYQLLCLKTQ